MSPPIQCLDIGCGYSAALLRGLSPYIDEGIGVDVALSKDLENCDNLKLIEGPIEDVFCNQLKERLLSLIIMNSVLEHIADSVVVLEQCYSHLKEEGFLLVNVPTWLGKRFLEFSAFKLKWSPESEMDDHKMYYDKKQLWPLLVRAGFKPSRLRLQYHKFGLNLFCVAQK